MPPRDYARLHWDWYEDPVLAEAADEEPAALWLWPLLIAMAKEASHAHTNPTGKLKTSTAQLARVLHVERARIERAVELLQDGDLVTVTPDGKMAIVLELPAFARWQAPRWSAAEKQQLRRDASRGFVVSRTPDVPSAYTERGERREEKEGKELSLPSPLSGTTTEKPAIEKGPTADEVRKVFDAWRGLFGRNANTKLDDTRRARIKWAWREYGKEVVWKVLRGYSKDPWRHEATSRHDLKVLLKNAASIERGLELDGEGGEGPGGDDLERMGY